MQRHQHRIISLCFRVLGPSRTTLHEAEDIAQDVFVAVHRNASRFRGDCKFTTWIYGITVNHCRNHVKYLARHRQHQGADFDTISESALPGAEAVSFASPHETAEAKELQDVIQVAISALDEEQRVVLVLADIEEMPYQEIVRVTGWQEGTVKSRLHRARLAVKAAVEQHMRGAGKEVA